MVEGERTKHRLGGRIRELSDLGFEMRGFVFWSSSSSPPSFLVSDIYSVWFDKCDCNLIWPLYTGKMCCKPMGTIDYLTSQAEKETFILIFQYPNIATVCLSLEDTK